LYKINKLFYKLLAAFVLISIIPLLTASWLNYNHTINVLNKGLNSYVEEVQEQKLNALNLLTSDLKRMEDIIAKNNTVKQFLSNHSLNNRYYQSFIQLDPIVAGLQSIRPENVGITIINEHNMVYYYGYTLNRDHSVFSEFDWMPDLDELHHGSYFSAPHARPYILELPLHDPDQFVFSYVSSFYDFTFSSKGILIIDFPLQFLQQLIKDSDSSELSGTFIVDRDGNLLYPQTLTAFSEEYAAHHHASQNEVITLANGRSYQMYYKQDPQTQWTIVSYFAQQELYADVFNYREVIVTILALSALLCLAASFFTSYRVSNPIMNLVKTMKKVERGDLSQRIHIKQRDEIGQLGIGFNRMIRQIEYLIAKVYEQQQKKRAAEISALQAQINPHFLYNALESINSLARKNKQNDICKQIALLGKLLRFSISTFSEFVTIEKEINYVEHYLLINKLRMKQDEFHYVIDFPPSTLNLYTIKWILQPIVENAIIHGLEPIGRKGRIAIIGKESGEHLIITVEDNGKGIPKERLEEIRFRLEHDAEDLTKYGRKVGLYNVQSRIRLHYGPEYGITIDSSPGEGTAITLLLPRRTSSDEAIL